MRENLTRRTAVASALLLVPVALTGQTLTEPARPAPQEPQLVKEWVGKAHQRKLDPMRELLKREPNIIHASWDWGGGDWESALQAAAHTGSQEMARFLLDQGARLDLVAAAMLGELAFLKTALEAFPRSLTVRGAHGIPLLSHAIAGDTAAAPVVDYLLAKGADVNAVHNNGSTPLFIAVQIGRRQTVQLLLAKGANANARALNGGTPLAISLKAGKTEIADDLRAAGATSSE